MKRALFGLFFIIGSLTLFAADGPLTPWANARGRTDSNGYLLTSYGAYAASDGPLTTMAMLQVRTDSNGYLITTPGAGNLPLANTSCYTWVAADSAFCRDAANQVAIRNGVTGQTFRVYNTFTDTSNYESIKASWSGNVATIQTDNLGTGTARALAIGTGTTARITISSAGIIGLGSGNTILGSTSGGAVSISSGFGTSPSILSSNSSFTFRVNVGTGGAATTGVIGMPTSTTGWNCQVTDLTNNTVTRQTASTTATVTVTAAAAWAASDTLIFNCMGY